MLHANVDMHSAADAIDYRGLNDDRSTIAPETAAKVIALVAIGLNICSTGFITFLWSRLWLVPPGTLIRPMGPAILSLLNIAMNVLFGSSCGTGCIILGWRRRQLVLLGILAICLGFAPAAMRSVRGF